MGDNVGFWEGRTEGFEIVGGNDGNEDGDWVSWQFPLTAPFNAKYP